MRAWRSWWSSEAHLPPYLLPYYCFRVVEVKSGPSAVIVNPWWPRTLHIENIFGCMLWCLFPSCCVFGRLVMRKVLGNHAPLLLIKAFKHSCVCFVSSLYVVSSCDERVFWACPFTSPPHKGVQAFVFAFLSPSLYVRPSCNKGVFERAHAPLLLIKVYKHSCLYSLLAPFLVRSASCDEGAFRACPYTPPPHKGVWAFMNVFSSFP